jgi:hypothetical protein
VIKKFLYVNIPAKEKFIEPDHYHAWTPEEFIVDVEKHGFRLVEGPILKKKLNRCYFKFLKE